MTNVTETLRVTVQHVGATAAVVTVAGDMDLHTASVLSEHALTVVQEGAPHLVLDLAQVDFVDSTGLSTLINLMHATQEAHGSLRLAAVPERLARMVTMTGISQLIPVHATVAEALAVQAEDDPAGRAGGEARSVG
ncbi:STAS domain-containing protein [Streptomyces sp. NPDC004596]|uniref:STAS domain-containing protein n=1 Tax=unclassified Streptomyces TaxID=2593676 RepID=UPI0036BFD2F9